MKPEDKARQKIDQMLDHSGYIVQDIQEFKKTAACGVAVREYPTNSGPVDYLLFINGCPIGVLEAKAENKGVSLTTVVEQSKRYAESGLKHVSGRPDIRFTYESTGVLTHFCDFHDIKARSREVFSFHRPETLSELLKDSGTLRNRMKSFPSFNGQGLFRKCQVTAIRNLEQSLADNKPRALIQMATGAGKTYTAITSVYRLLKYAKARRVLFLVDTKNLGEQAEGEFLKYRPPDDVRLFAELYNVRRLNSPHIPPETKVCISTIQRMYSILRGEELDDSVEETSMNEQRIIGSPREVAYNSEYPPEFFDFVIIDECHRSIYNVWQQVLDYFDAFLIGLTATPDNRTFGYFKQNIVSEYTHEQAVLDDVNVGREGTYLIETNAGNKGGVILKQIVQKRDRLSRRKRWEQLDDDFTYAPTQLDRDVVNPSQIRAVISAFRDALSEMFPDRVLISPGQTEIPKTLIFAKTDSHADDIINTVREVFSEGNEFCKKITYATDDPKSVLNSFRNDFYPRIAVTVDMIATGTDVKPIECLIFMRDVRSKNYFEQMLGRATRTLDYENLHRVSPSATQRKLGYIIVDAVGVTTSQKTTSRQLERKPSVSLKDIMMSVAMGAHDDDTLTTLASRLARLDKVMTAVEKEKFTALCHDECISLGIAIVGSIEVPFDGEISVIAIAETLLNAFDEDVIEEVARKKFDIEEAQAITDEQMKTVSRQMAIASAVPFDNPKLRDYIENVRKTHDQVIDNVNIDEVTFSGWDSEPAKKAGEVIESFARFIEDNKDNIDALKIIYSQSYRNRTLTLRMVEELYEILWNPPYHLTTEKLWMAYSIRRPDKVRQKSVINKLADIVSLIRFQLGQTDDLRLFSDVVNVRFREWMFDKNAGHGQFTEEQTEWLQMVRDHIAASMSITVDDLGYTPFDAKGGLGKFHQLFGDEYESILNEMNHTLLKAA
ncbi:MAG: DEAD/DEAH box helicase family protein [Deltaproteobacteria bacterium]|jgi:type I restriction enzyme R subunit|nr:DEAD/DEAH box helicase family protein [Deltaproteobacteria bacterium]